MGSRHGTKVNGTIITGRNCLNEGDEVQIGETTLRMDPS